MQETKVKEIKKLDINEKQNCVYAIDLWRRDEQVKSAMSKIKRRLGDELGKGETYPLRNEKIAVVCFAPSLNDTWEEIKNFKYIISCSGAHKFLIERGIIPTWQIDVDPREHKIKLLGEPHKDVIYLAASTCHPKYFDYLHDYNVVLWHIFASEEEAMRTLPRGEWAICGGSSAGLRAMTMARFLGFTDLHIFGMDGNQSDKYGKHAAEHPNQAKDFYECEYDGVTYKTTPSILHCATETFHELNQMQDVKATFYGTGLVQHMAKNYKPNYRKGVIGFNKPELISEEYRELNAKLHRDNLGYGVGGGKHVDTVVKLAKTLITPENQFVSVLDYGAGKMYLSKAMPFPIASYDPAIPEISQSPKAADLVVSSDCLEHIEPEKLPYVLDDLKRCVKHIGYFVISTREAVKTYANGKNTHLIVQGKDWWNKQLSKYFDVGTVIEKDSELHVVVAPKTKKIIPPDRVTTVTEGDLTVKFYTPNETAEWRAQTLWTKEPATIQWINGMKKGGVLYDVGANVGSYSILAGVKGVKVYAFEPEAENHALLIKNMELNGIEANAYCVAMSDTKKAGELFVNGGGAGGSCHSFGENLKPNLQPEDSRRKQGCISMTLDEMIKMGLPTPDYLKIDVDGLEYNVIKGGEYVLKNGITSLLVEVNPEIEEHKKMVEYLVNIGFSYDKSQVEKAARKSGAFKGVAEYIFVKKQNRNSRMARRINDATLHSAPFPYLYVENIFDKNLYKTIIASMPTDYVEIEKSRGTKGYPKRFTATPTDEFWTNLNEQLLSGELKEALLKKFSISDDGYSEDLLLIKDNPGYAIPPHTDSTSKIISALFYLPEDDSLIGEGTSLFTSKEEGFICEDGRHYDFDSFNKVKTMSFKPNSLFVFARSNNSFHGVEPCSGIRNVLLYNIKK